MRAQRLKSGSSKSIAPSLRRGIAMAVIAALIGMSAPREVKAAWQDNSGNLPGMVSGKQIALIAAAGGAAIVGLLLYKRHKGPKKATVDVEPPRFGNVPVGESERRAVTLTNRMAVPITVKAVSLESQTGPFTLPQERPVPFTVAPGEQVTLPVVFTPKSSGGFKGQLRIVAAGPKSKESVQVVSFSSPGTKAGRRLLILPRGGGEEPLHVR